MHPWLRVRKYGFWLAYAAVALYVVLFITKNFLNNPMIYYSYVGWTIGLVRVQSTTDRKNGSERWSTIRTVSGTP